MKIEHLYTLYFFWLCSMPYNFERNEPDIDVLVLIVNVFVMF